MKVGGFHLNSVANLSNHWGPPLSSINYSRFLQPEKEANNQIKKELMLLRRFEATISYPILIKLFAACDNNQFDEETLIKCLKHLNSFIVRRAVCDEKRSALNRLFVNIAARIPPDIERLDEWIYTEMTKRVRSERWPDDTEIRSAVVGTNLYGTKAARVVLEGIETYIAGKEVVDLSSEKITVEHIMPQTLNADWSCHIGGNNAEEVHRKYLDTLGNLTLTGINSELSNLSFIEKKKMYADSGISMNRALLQFDRWSEPEIIKRAQMIADYTIKIWPR